RATSDLHLLSLHDALPISHARLRDCNSPVSMRITEIRPSEQAHARLRDCNSKLFEEAGDRGNRVRTGPRPIEGLQIFLEGYNIIDRKSTRLNSSHLVISYA